MLAYAVCLVCAFLACLIGKICGMGGGVIIKPILDSLGIMSSTSINFLSSCTVLGMSLWSVVLSFSEREQSSTPNNIELSVSFPLGIGAAIGGIIGKKLYTYLVADLPEQDMVAGIQAFVLCIAIAGTLVFNIRKKKIKTFRIKCVALSILIGYILGMTGVFLGIGGGPFNMVALSLFFSMPTKKAAQNSIFMICISQSAALVLTIINKNNPDLPLSLLVLMIFFGVVGCEIGANIIELPRLNRC